MTSPKKLTEPKSKVEVLLAALNYAAYEVDSDRVKGWLIDWIEGDEVEITELEHHKGWRPFSSMNPNLK